MRAIQPPAAVSISEAVHGLRPPSSASATTWRSCSSTERATAWWPSWRADDRGAARRRAWAEGRRHGRHHGRHDDAGRRLFFKLASELSPIIGTSPSGVNLFRLFLLVLLAAFGRLACILSFFPVHACAAGRAARGDLRLWRPRHPARCRSGGAARRGRRADGHLRGRQDHGVAPDRPPDRGLGRSGAV